VNAFYRRSGSGWPISKRGGLARGAPSLFSSDHLIEAAQSLRNAHLVGEKSPHLALQLPVNRGSVIVEYLNLEKATAAYDNAAYAEG
jgi:hypothetical protein